MANAVYLLFFTQGLVLNFDFSEFPEKIHCPESNSYSQGQTRLCEVEWCWGWDLDRTFSNICPHTESPVLLTHFFCLQVAVLTSLKALSHHVDPSQMPPALEGSFPYCHSEWVQFFQVSTVTAFSPVPSLLPFLPSLSGPWIHPHCQVQNQSVNKSLK